MRVKSRHQRSNKSPRRTIWRTSAPSPPSLRLLHHVIIAHLPHPLAFLPSPSITCSSHLHCNLPSLPCLFSNQEVYHPYPYSSIFHLLFLTSHITCSSQPHASFPYSAPLLQPVSNFSTCIMSHSHNSCSNYNLFSYTPVLHTITLLYFFHPFINPS